MGKDLRSQLVTSKSRAWKKKMPRELKIGRAVYLVDDKTKTYRYLRRNPGWRSFSPEKNEANKKAIDGYTRVLRGGLTKIYKREDHP